MFSVEGNRTCEVVAGRVVGLDFDGDVASPARTGAGVPTACGVAGAVGLVATELGGAESNSNFQLLMIVVESLTRPMGVPTMTTAVATVRFHPKRLNCVATRRRKLRVEVFRPLGDPGMTAVSRSWSCSADC